MVTSGARVIQKNIEQGIARASKQFKEGDLRWRALVVIGRYTSHIAIVVVTFLAIVLATLRLNTPTSSSNVAQGAIEGVTGAAASNIPLITGPHINNLSQIVNAQAFSQNVINAVNQENGVISRLIVPQTNKPIITRSKILSYTVQPGDNVEAIAATYGLLPSTIVWANPKVEESPDQLDVGQVLTILPTDGIYYSVQPGDTVDSIAKKFKATTQDIVTSPLNGLSGGANLLPGTRVVVPGGVKPFVFQDRIAQISSSGQAAAQPAARPQTAARAATGAFRLPVPGYVLTQNYWAGHRGIDMANNVGTPIYASDNGYVSFAGWSTVGYGNLIIVNHNNGFSTIYAHLSRFYVVQGQPVARGQTIGAMGNTGNSTGPHLHFEIRLNNVTVNPFIYLR